MSSTTPKAAYSSDEAIPRTIQSGIQNIALSTATGLVAGGLASIVLVRGGGGAGRKAVTLFGGGLGLGSAWTRVSMEIEDILK